MLGGPRGQHPLLPSHLLTFPVMPNKVRYSNSSFMSPSPSLASLFWDSFGSWRSRSIRSSPPVGTSHASGVPEQQHPPLWPRPVGCVPCTFHPQPRTRPRARSPGAHHGAGHTPQCDLQPRERAPSLPPSRSSLLPMAPVMGEKGIHCCRTFSSPTASISPHVHNLCGTTVSNLANHASVSHRSL